MPKGAARSSGSSGELVSHFNAVRMRVVGSGSLRLRLNSLDDVRSADLLPITMASSMNIEPMRLANFVEQRASLEVKTTNIDEWFRINRIVVYSRYMWSGYPG